MPGVTNQPKKKRAPKKKTEKDSVLLPLPHTREKKTREKYHLLSHFGDAQTNTIDMGEIPSRWENGKKKQTQIEKVRVDEEESCSKLQRRFLWETSCRKKSEEENNYTGHHLFWPEKTYRKTKEFIFIIRKSERKSIGCESKKQSERIFWEMMEWIFLRRHLESGGEYILFVAHKHWLNFFQLPSRQSCIRLSYPVNHLFIFPGSFGERLWTTLFGVGFYITFVDWSRCMDCDQCFPIDVEWRGIFHHLSSRIPILKEKSMGNKGVK